MFHASCKILRIQRLEGKQVDPDEVAHYEPPYLDLHCLQIQVFSFMALYVLPFVVTVTVWSISHFMSRDIGSGVIYKLLQNQDKIWR